MKKFAFTLAETLVVMGIIGVVAALTLPNLNSSTGDKEKVAKVKKIYQNLTDAFGRAKSVYGPYTEWCISLDSVHCNERVMQRITEFMKISKNCGTSANCMPSIIKYLTGTETGLTDDAYKCITADGTAIGFDDDGEIVVDIDGLKGSNFYGKDIFRFYLDKDDDELHPFAPTDEDRLKEMCFKYGDECAGWVIQNENLDYLKADRTGKCPNNVQLSLTTISCK